MKNANFTLPLCEAKVACDGNELRHNRTICGPCEKAIAKRTKKPAPLRGANTAVPQYDRRGLPPRD